MEQTDKTATEIFLEKRVALKDLGGVEKSLVRAGEAMEKDLAAARASIEKTRDKFNAELSKAREKLHQ